MILLEHIKQVAKSFVKFEHEEVFVGGSILPHYVDNNSKLDIRPFTDIDLCFSIKSYMEYNMIIEGHLGFINTTKERDKIIEILKYFISK